MTNTIDYEVALTVLRKYDSQCLNIIDSCNKVKVYNFDKIKNSWIIQDQSEGVFYLIKRVLSPLYKFVILGKYNKPGSVPSTIDIPISQYFVSECRQNYYMFKNELGIIQAIMFSNKIDCDRIFKKVDRIIKELKLAQETVSQKARTPIRPNLLDTMSGVLVNNIMPESVSDTIFNDDKILNLLESARQRYHEGQGDQVILSTSAPDRRSRQIDINELFMNSNGPTTPNAASNSPANVSMSSSLPQRTNATRTMSLDLYDNGPTTLTVTELEKYFVQGASVSDNHRTTVFDDSDEDDDGRLLDPHLLFIGGSNASTTNTCPRESLGPLLSKEQLRDALIHMLQTDDEEDGGVGGNFLTRLHSAYVDLCHKRASVARK